MLQFEIIKEIAVLRTAENGWTIEFNLVSWYGKEPKHDIRWWSPDKKKAGKGITLTNEEFDNLGIQLNELEEKRVGQQ